MNEATTNRRAIDVAADMAVELGAGWSAGPGAWSSLGDHSDAYLRGPHGEKVHVTVGGYGFEDRVGLSMSPDVDLHEFHYSYSDPAYPSITVSASKTARQMARDIERRLLPPLREKLATLRERKQASDDYNARRTAGLAELDGWLGGGTVRRGDRSELELGRWGDSIHGTIALSSDDVEFTIRVKSPLAAQKIAELIAKLR